MGTRGNGCGKPGEDLSRTKKPSLHARHEPHNHQDHNSVPTTPIPNIVPPVEHLGQKLFRMAVMRRVRECLAILEHKAEHNNCRMRGSGVRLGTPHSDCKCFTTSEGGDNDPFAKPLYGLTPVPRVRIPASPPASLNCREFPPPLIQKYAKHARISQYFVLKPDCREWTAQQRTR
jgi:hypothetical protein